MVHLLTLLITGALAAAPSAFLALDDAADDRTAAPLSNVRSMSPRATAILLKGIRRSPTLARLVANVEASNVIAYVELVHNLPPSLNGRLMLVSKNRFHRYVRIQVRALLTEDEIIPMLGHELQHAVEIAQNPGIVNNATLRCFYERVGSGSSETLGFETEAARRMGHRVRHELMRKREPV